MATKLNVVWETNGGYPSVQTQELIIEDGENTVSLTPPVTPIRPGFTFTNWNLMDTPVEAFPYVYTVEEGKDTIYFVGQWTPIVDTVGRGIIILGVNPPVVAGSSGGSEAEIQDLENRVGSIEQVLSEPNYEILGVVKKTD